MRDRDDCEMLHVWKVLLAVRYVLLVYPGKVLVSYLLAACRLLAGDRWGTKNICTSISFSPVRCSSRIGTDSRQAIIFLIQKNSIKNV